MGAAIPDMGRMPDVMYAAGVSCDGCHTDVRFTRVGVMTMTSKVSGAKQCGSCHGDESYAEMLGSWQQETRERLAAIETDLAALEKACAATANRVKQAKLRRSLERARDRVSHVILDGSFGAHNYPYVSAILDSAEAELAKCRPLLARSRGDSPKVSRK